MSWEHSRSAKACPPSVTLETDLGHVKMQDAAVPLGETMVYKYVVPRADG